MAKAKKAPKLGLVVVKNGQPVTTSLIVAESFGRPHFRVMKSIKGLIERGKLTTGIVVSSWVDLTGRSNEIYELDERSFLIAMPFIGGAKAEDGQVALVDAFLAYHRAAARRKAPEWKAVRDDTKTALRFMQDSLVEQRKAAGKETKEVGRPGGGEHATVADGTLSHQRPGIDRAFMCSITCRCC